MRGWNYEEGSVLYIYSVDRPVGPSRMSNASFEFLAKLLESQTFSHSSRTATWASKEGPLDQPDLPN